MATSNYPFAQDERHDRISESTDRRWRALLQPPGGYTSWWGWLAGKAFPLTIFSLLFVNGGMTILQEARQLTHEEISLYQVLWLLRHSLTLGFLLLIMAAYLTRTHAIASAHGFWERAFPMLILFATFFGVSFLWYAAAPQRPDLIAAGLLLTLFGYYASLWALWHLRGSFAIMAEARSPVTSGPYQYIRHPLYLGETLTMLGFSLVMGTAPALLFWAAITGMQLMRARIEEAKLAQQFAEYRAYQERTRFILPGLY